MVSTNTCDIPIHKSNFFVWNTNEKKAWSTIPDLAIKLGYDGVIDYNSHMIIESIETGIKTHFIFEPKISNKTGMGYIFYDGPEHMKDWILFIFNKKDKT